MTRGLFVVCAALAALVSPAAHAVALEVYGHLPSVEDVALSPGGTRIAFVQTKDDSRSIYIFSLPDGKAVGALRVGDQKLRSIDWADEDNLMIVTSTATLPMGLVGSTTEWSMLQVYDVAHHETHRLPQPPTDEGITTMNVINGPVKVRRMNGHTVLFIPGIYLTHITSPALFRYDLSTHIQTMVRSDGITTQSWLVDADGKIVAEEDYDESGQRWAIKVRRNDSLQEVLSGHEAIESPQLLGFGPTPDTLLVDRLEDGEPVWRLLSMKDGSLGAPMAGQESMDVPIEDRLTSRLIGGIKEGDDPQYRFLDTDREVQWEAIIGAFAGERLTLVSSTDDFSKVVVLVEGAEHGYQYELVDLNQHSAKGLGSVYEGVTAPFAVSRITYPAADGLPIPAYLTLPRGKQALGLALVVLPHGGPAVRDTADFDWWSQALADQGYAVLRPNYRGSTVDSKFLAAGYGQWGRKMQTDLSDGVRYLAKKGIIDPGKVCIVGASYGGYAALAGVTLDPAVYRCAVSVAGIGDLSKFLKWSQEKHAFGDKRTERYWDRFLGVTGLNDPALDAISPIKHIDAVHVPVLLIHGRDDTVVPYKQSQLMYDALHRAGKSVELVTLKHEDHWLSHGDTRLQMLEATVKFLRANDPPG